MSAEGIRTDPERFGSVSGWPTPSTEKRIETVSWACFLLPHVCGISISCLNEDRNGQANAVKHSGN